MLHVILFDEYTSSFEIRDISSAWKKRAKQHPDAVRIVDVPDYLVHRDNVFRDLMDRHQTTLRVLFDKNSLKT